MAHDIELRRRPDPAPAAVPPHSPPAGAGVLLLRNCALGTEAARLDVAVLDPRRGVVLVAPGPPGSLPALAEALRRRLDEARFGAVFPGHLPVVVLPAEAWAAQQAAGAPLAARLEQAFADAPPLSLPPGGAWVPSVARLLRSPPSSTPPRGQAAWARRRRRTARLRWLAAGLGLGLLLIGGVAGLSERGRVFLGAVPPRADGAAAPPTLPPGQGIAVSGEVGRVAAMPERERGAAAPALPVAAATERPAAIDPAPTAAPARGEAGGRPAAGPEEAGAGAMVKRQEAGAGANARTESEPRAAAERPEAEPRAAAERPETKARAAAERREAERAARRAAAIDAALRARAEAARQRHQDEAEALRRAEADAAWSRQQEAETVLRAREAAEAARRAQQEERCRQILALLRAGAFPAEADLAFFDRRCMPG